MTEERHELEIGAPPAEALAAVAAVAADWGAEWTPGDNGGQLRLPVIAGLRRGLLTGRIEILSSGDDGSRLTLRAETTHWRVHGSAAAILVLGALGALPVILWPLKPELLALAPVGLVLMFLAWFMVISRLRTAGAVEFLEALDHHLGDPSGH